eukprot:TRINITY_DN46718_c0_g1_i1.p2 TRINITY_DN46718_c0_g1~~TRINITY_DN46718_c0_g1_i1.p2  ORF type:complete len:108 (+),score=6.91 TRINITY_DN46718_c0_g1_i1:172-495(+)
MESSKAAHCWKCYSDAVNTWSMHYRTQEQSTGVISFLATTIDLILSFLAHGSDCCLFFLLPQLELLPALLRRPLAVALAPAPASWPAPLHGKRAPGPPSKGFSMDVR